MKKSLITAFGATAVAAAALLCTASPATASVSPANTAAKQAPATKSDSTRLTGKFVMVHLDQPGKPIRYAGIAQQADNPANHKALLTVDLAEAKEFATEFSFPALGTVGQVLTPDGKCLTLQPSTDASRFPGQLLQCYQKGDISYGKQQFSYETLPASVNAGEGWYLRSNYRTFIGFGNIPAGGLGVGYTTGTPMPAQAARFDPTLLEAPHTAVPVTIKSPATGSTTGSRPEFAGLGEPGANVVVKDQSNRELCTAVVQADGSWRCSSSVSLTEGPWNATATQTAGEAVTTATTVFVVESKIAPLTASVNSVDHEEKSAILTGTGEPGATITITTPTGKQTATVTASGRWALVAKGLSTGENTIPVTQTVDGKITGTVNLTVIVNALETPLADPAMAGGTLLMALTASGTFLALRRKTKKVTL